MSGAPDTSATSLYPADGGAAAAAASAPGVIAPPAETTAASAGTDTVAGAAGADTVAGTETTAGADSVAGAETTAGVDSITADSYQFTLPEGFTEDAGLTTDARAAFLEAGVSPDKAQSLIDLFGKAVSAANTRATAAHQTEQGAWVSEINSMPEFQGPTRETSLQSIGRLFDEYGTPEAKAALDRQGIGNNPALVKMMLKIATTLTEGAPAGQGRPTLNPNRGTNKATTVGEALYPSS